jgi:hypothetical protein
MSSLTMSLSSSLALPQRSCFELALRVVIAPDSLIMVFDIVLRLFKARLLRESQSMRLRLSDVRRYT